jgi:predicted esterase
MEEREYAGVCGLYCGLCPRFQSTAPSRCLGCQLGPQHDYCSVYRCARKLGYWTCAECGEYPCERLLHLMGEDVDSFLSHRPMLPNLDRTREVGLDAHLDEQRERRLLAEQLIGQYNEGRSMTFYCTAAALLAPGSIRQALQEMEALLSTGQVDAADLKARAKAMKGLIQERAEQAGIDLKLRRKKDGA